MTPDTPEQQDRCGGSGTLPQGGHEGTTRWACPGCPECRPCVRCGGSGSRTTIELSNADDWHCPCCHGTGTAPPTPPSEQQERINLSFTAADAAKLYNLAAVFFRCEYGATRTINHDIEVVHEDCVCDKCNLRRWFFERGMKRNPLLDGRPFPAPPTPTIGDNDGSAHHANEHPRPVRRSDPSDRGAPARPNRGTDDAAHRAARASSPAPVIPEQQERRKRRAKVREVCAVLRSDLYDRGKSFDGEDPHESATWWSPGGLSVTYGYDEQRVWIRCRDSRGKVYAETPDGDASWLDLEML